MAEPSTSPRHVVPDQSELVRLLAERSIACPGCGYNLRGLTSGTCPECNSPLMLRVAPAMPRMAAFITGVSLISAFLGFCFSVLAYMSSQMLLPQARRSVPLVSDLIPLVVGTLVCGALLAWWLQGRRRLSSRSAGSRWLRVLAAALVAAACPVWFLIVAR